MKHISGDMHWAFICPKGVLSHPGGIVHWAGEGSSGLEH